MIKPWKLRRMAALRRRLGPQRYQMLQLHMAIGELNRRRVALAREAREIDVAVAS
jgi:hypothetical protein